MISMQSKPGLWGHLMKRASVARQSVVAGKTSDFLVASVPGKHGEFRFAIFSFRLISFYSATRRLNQWLPVRQCLTFWESHSVFLSLAFGLSKQ